LSHSSHRTVPRSYVQPLLLIVVVPFGLIGALVGHGLLGYDLTTLSAVVDGTPLWLDKSFQAQFLHPLAAAGLLTEENNAPTSGRIMRRNV
jgi:hypothetical protein